VTVALILDVAAGIAGKGAPPSPSECMDTTSPIPDGDEEKAYKMDDRKSPR
jgi:hypothetical protein